MEVAIGATKRRRSTTDHGDRLTKKRREEEREEASVAKAMERIARDDFPTELLWKIIGFSLRSGIGRCDISVHDEPATLRAGGLAWPKTLSLKALGTIRRAVAYMLPESVILEISAEFEPQASSGGGRPRLVIPLALQGSENRVRNLVLNVDLNLKLILPNYGSRFPQWPSLDTATAGIKTMAKSFPNLETCVLAVYIGHFERYVGNVDPRLRAFPPAFPRLRSNVSASGSLEDRLVDLIDAFGKYGPGKRRLLRFECQERFVGRCSGVGRGKMQPFWKVHVGPLVRVDALSENDDASDIGNEASPESEPGRRLLRQAYNFTRQIRS